MAGNLTTPRKRALEIGTDKGNFPADVPYDTGAGVPSSDSGGTYSDPVEHATPKAGGAPDPTPFGNVR